MKAGLLSLRPLHVLTVSNTQATYSEKNKI